MEKIIKIIFILLIITLINFQIGLSVYAASPTAPATVDFNDMVREAEDFINEGQSQAGTMSFSGNAITNNLRPIAQAATTIGVGILLIVTVYMGIKWVTAKPDEQAKLKQQTIGLLVAAIVIFGAYTIWSIALKIVSKF